MISPGPCHFSSSCWPFTCSEYLEEKPADSLMMVVQQYPIFEHPRKQLCETCGKKFLFSEEQQGQ